MLVWVLALLCRELAQIIVRLFYPWRAVVNEAGLPARGPVIYLSNHVNGLMDPLLIRVVVGRPARFLAKSTLFGNPFGRLAMKAFGCVTIHRAHDRGSAGLKARAAANEAAFAHCREALSRGEALALFPEGVSHSEPGLMPLKKGAARIALSAEREHRARTGQPLGLMLVPLGLGYRSKAVFRSGVRVVAGPPIPVADLLAEPSERSSEDALTERMRAALEKVVTAADRPEPPRRRGWWGTLGLLLALLVTAPVALVGALLGGLPYGLAGYVANRITDEEDMVATLKMLAGALFLTVFWLAEAVVAGGLFGGRWALPVFVGAIASGYVAVRFSDGLRALHRVPSTPLVAPDAPAETTALARRRSG